MRLSSDTPAAIREIVSVRYSVTSYYPCSDAVFSELALNGPEIWLTWYQHTKRTLILSELAQALTLLTCFGGAYFEPRRGYRLC
jgi:hypothetical protein